MFRSLLLLAVAVPTAAYGGRLSMKESSVEPPLRMVLTIDGTEHAMVDGKETEIEIKGQKVKAKANVLPVRTFEGAGIRFDFPRDMAWAHEPGEDAEIWTLDGDEFVIHVNSYPAGDPLVLAEETVKGIAEKVDEGTDPKPVRTEFQLGMLTCSAYTVEIGLAGFGMSLTAIALPMKERPVVILLQRGSEDQDENKAETQQVMELLRTTFRLVD
jgi:hypothetical protein